MKKLKVRIITRNKTGLNKGDVKILPVDVANKLIDENKAELIGVVEFTRKQDLVSTVTKIIERQEELENTVNELNEKFIKLKNEKK